MRSLGNHKDHRLIITILVMIFLLLVTTRRVQAQEQVNWAQSNLGSTSGSFVPDTIYTIAGNGSFGTSAGTNDQFSWARALTYTAVDLRALISVPPAGFAGIMVRRSQLAYSAHISVGLNSTSQVQLVYRNVDNGATTTPTPGPSVSGDTLFKIVEIATTATDATFQASYSDNGGASWTDVGGPITIADSNWHQGMTVVSGTGSIAKANFKQLSLTQQQLNDGGFQIEDIGSPTLPGQVHFNYSYSGGGAGEGVLVPTIPNPDLGKTDSVNFAYFPVTADAEMTTRIVSMSGTDVDAFAGLSIRDALTSNGAQLTVGVTHSDGIKLRYRTVAGGTNSESTMASITAPTWLRLRRSGNSISVFNSSDGQTWSQVGSTQTLALPSTANIGFATASGGVTINKVVHDNVTLWTGQSLQDIGSTGAPGTVSYSGSTATFTVEGAGTGIGATSGDDKYTFVGVPISGDRTQITTYIDSLENTDANAFAGPMLRYPITSTSQLAAVGVTPSDAKFTFRGQSGTTTTTLTGTTAPKWLRLVVTYGTVTGYVSSNFTDWTQISKGYLGMGAAQYGIGMMVASGINGTLSTAVLNKLSVLQRLAPTSQDIGTTGTYSYNSGSKTYTLTGVGSFGGSEDSSNVILGAAAGNIELMGKVATQTNTNAYSAAGFMIRESTASNAKFAAVTVSPSNGVVFTYRTTTGQPATTTLGPTVAAPAWLRLVRSGNVIGAYFSADQTNWILVGKCSMSLPTTYYAGFTLNSFANEVATTATFTNVYQLNKVPQRSDTSMSMWLRGDSGIITYPGFSVIRDWIDQSVNGNSGFNTSVGLQPELLSGQSVNNYLPTANYWTGRFFELGSDFKDFTGASCYIVMTPKTVYSSGRRLLELSSNLNQFWIAESNTTGGITCHVKNMPSTDSNFTASAALPTPVISPEKNSLLEVFHHGAALTGTIYVNGASKTITGTPLNLANNQRIYNLIGADTNFSSAGWYMGDISEILLFNLYNSTERVNLETYFNNKYAIGAPAQLAAPTLTPRNKLATSTPQTVTISASPDAQIVFTLDGTDPWNTTTQQVSPNARLYNGALTISENTTIKAVAVQPHFLASAITEGRIEFDPNAVPPAQPGLYAWFRSDIALKSTGGSPDYITLWGDISGNSYIATPGADTTRPQKTTISMLPALSFDGSNDYLQITPDLTDWNGATIFIVVHPNSPLATSDRFFEFGTAASTNSIRLYMTNTAGTASGQIYEGTAGTTVNAASAITAATTQILEFRHDGGPSTTAVAKIYTNGQEKGSSSNMKTIVDVARDSFIGRAFSAANYLNGKIFEFIIYNQNLSDTQRTNVTNYLKSRYGL